MHVNWKSLTMRFTVGEVAVILQGDSSMCSSLISLKAMIKAIRGEGEAILLELCMLESYNLVLALFLTLLCWLRTRIEEGGWVAILCRLHSPKESHSA